MALTFSFPRFPREASAAGGDCMGGTGCQEVNPSPKLLHWGPGLTPAGYALGLGTVRPVKNASSVPFPPALSLSWPEVTWGRGLLPLPVLRAKERRREEPRRGGGKHRRQQADSGRGAGRLPPHTVGPLPHATPWLAGDRMPAPGALALTCPGSTCYGRKDPWGSSPAPASGSLLSSLSLARFSVCALCRHSPALRAHRAP